MIAQDDGLFPEISRERQLAVGDLEYDWDQADPVLKAKDRAEWTKIDKKIDTVLRELRAVQPNPATEKAALEALLTVFS